MTRFAIGVDIGGTKIAAALVSENGDVNERVSLPTPHEPAAIVAAVIALCQTLIARSLQSNITALGIGIGTAGQVDFASGTITYAVATLPGWAGTPLAQRVHDALELPVAVDNDVNALAIGESHFGAGRGLRSALYVALGTGIGGALLIDGALWRGAHGSAGEIGHILVDPHSTRMCNCGQTGHLEALAAGPALAERYAELRGLPPQEDHPDLRLVATLAQQGDSLAQQAISEGAHLTGLALGGILNLLDTQALILGGGVIELGALWWQPFEQALRTSPLPCPQRVQLMRAELGIDAGLIGAAQLIFSGMHQALSSKDME